ncbi:uncharacterized protein EI97DRAFT_455655 [Westerdykella ornata]|uniref:Maleylacetoacetate isomerase n=1 Tax=Westerdykella ornata TaxID=318751 RepID=A0A6A6JUI0_WESOR|nr:uncharacterized protein EI97DRAFT_455655 [Westerdykella ornata]KAF2279406.1 hypothetical protein EI97DRAFT_455655 [Westerdykella ornata]
MARPISKQLLRRPNPHSPLPQTHPLTTTFVSLDPSTTWPPPTITSLNPSAKVPILSITPPNSTTGNEGGEDGKNPIILTQSPAILEYLEETFPSRTPLLPRAPHEWQKRAKVRELVSLICTDIQPPTNQSCLLLINHLSTSLATSVLPESSSLAPFTPQNPSPGKLFAVQILTSGLAAYDALIAECAGKFSVGDEVTLADVCLVPAVLMAEGYGVDFNEERFARVRRVFEECMGMWEFREGSRREGEEKRHPCGLEQENPRVGSEERGAEE